MSKLETRRILPANAANVRDQFNDIGKRVQRDMLELGDRGPVVEDLQRRLRSFGVFDGKADGVFDRQTQAAVRAFQRKAGITADGVAGPQTLREMRAHTRFVKDGFETPAQQGERGADIRNAERALKDLGFNPGKVDGVFDQATADAVKRFRDIDPTLPGGARIDSETMDRLKERGSKPLARGSHGRRVRVLEKNLDALGLKTGKVDGKYTERTRDAVKAFQRKNDLDPTGIADVKTRQEIQEAVDAKPDTPAEIMARWDRTAPKANYGRTHVDGEEVNHRTNEMLRRAQFIMREKFGHKNFDFGIVQGSYSHGVSASAGTHDGGGALDMHTRTLPKNTVDDMVKALRMAGFAAWSRGRGHDSMDPHIHAIAIGDRQASAHAKQQVQEYFNGGDGLVGSSADPDRHLGRPIPRWARRFNR